MRLVLTLFALLVLTPSLAAQDKFPAFDWTRGQTLGWTATHDVGALRATSDGLTIPVTGSDPYVTGPARDFPARQMLWLTLRLKSDTAGDIQIFWFNDGPREENSGKAFVPGGVWTTVKIPVPPLGPNTRLRLDPPGTSGQTVLASLTFSPRALLAPPAFPPSDAPHIADAFSLRSGDVTLTHSRTQWGGFVVKIKEKEMATGGTRPVIGFLTDETPQFLDATAGGTTTVTQAGGKITARLTATDGGDAQWTVTQTFAASKKPGAIDVTASVRVSQTRSVIFLPLLTLLPGAHGGFGAHKTQGLFAGVEYLDDEPSRSEADIRGPEANRKVPDALKLTMPLMAIAAEHRWIALTWDENPNVAALFDSPDRTFGAGGHVFGLQFPGATDANRAPGDILPYDGVTLEANKTVTVKATILGGTGTSVTDAVKAFVARRGLPPIPKTPKNWDGYAALAASGWLESGVNAGGGLFRHAVPGAFGPQPAADAAAELTYLARHTLDVTLKSRLQTASAEAAHAVPPADFAAARVGHVAPPAAPLVFGHASDAAERALTDGRELLKRFAANGSVPYVKPANGDDLGETSATPDANGLTAQVVSQLLEDAFLSGDKALKDAGIAKLRASDKWAGTVPRGAQTWEVPLHTPDILASANLVRAYTLGYQLTGDAAFLASAREWAWTGVPFVYLRNPTNQPIGPYATIAVFGATHWTAPNWLGLPVQWCGLVYADALYELARFDASGPWRQLADGITVSGIQQSFPVGFDPLRQGLLPDSFALRPQSRRDPAINSGTLFPEAVRLFRQPTFYDVRVFRQSGVIVHVPGALTVTADTPHRVAFSVTGWPNTPYEILIVGLPAAPTSVMVDGKTVTDTHFDAGRLVVRVSGAARVEIALP